MQLNLVLVKVQCDVHDDPSKKGASKETVDLKKVLDNHVEDVNDKVSMQSSHI